MIGLVCRFVFCIGASWKISGWCVCLRVQWQVLVLFFISSPWPGLPVWPVGVRREQGVLRADSSPVAVQRGGSGGGLELTGGGGCCWELSKPWPSPGHGAVWPLTTQMLGASAWVVHSGPDLVLGSWQHSRHRAPVWAQTPTLSGQICTVHSRGPLLMDLCIDQSQSGLISLSGKAETASWRGVVWCPQGLCAVWWSQIGHLSTVCVSNQLVSI